MNCKEITFIVAEDPEGGYIAHALGEPIFTQADRLEQLHDCIREAVRCHFEEGEEPQIVHLHHVREEIIAL